MDNTRYGFCAQDHSQEYKCANCGHRETKTQMTNFYDHKIVEWEDKVCIECGFKSLKPMSMIDLLSKEDLESLRENVAKLIKKKKENQ